MPLICRQFVCLALPILIKKSKNLPIEEPNLLVKIPIYPVHTTEKRMAKFLRCAASIAGSGAEYPEHLNTQKKKKGRSIAGVDQEELLDPALLADPDSFFCNFKGIQMHHKICHNEEEFDQPFQIQNSSQLSNKIEKVGFPIILLHGFGASVYSWDRVMKPLARLTVSKVLAFDRPAFGLTSRIDNFGHSTSGEVDTTPLNPYSMSFSVLATLSFIDFLGAEKAILMGHSSGCDVAANTYFEAPERVAALIFVAPAIRAPFVPRNALKENTIGRETHVEDGSPKSPVKQNLNFRIWKGICKLCAYIAQMATKMVKVMKDMVSSLYRKALSTIYSKGICRLCAYIAQLATEMVKGMKDMVSSLYKKALSTILRSTFAIMLVRIVMDKFGLLAIRNAWYDANQVTDHVIQGYTKPLRAKGWDKALLEYTLSMLMESTSESKPPLATRLSEITCPVLIVTGDTDRLVPSWNAKRLSLAIPGSTFQVINNCGHLPHEERVEEFMLVIQKFLQKVYGDQGGLALASNS